LLLLINIPPVKQLLFYRAPFVRRGSSRNRGRKAEVLWAGVDFAIPAA